jgi:hypothetical protein
MFTPYMLLLIGKYMVWTAVPRYRMIIDEDREEDYALIVSE